MLTSRPNSYQNTHARRQNYDKLQAQLRVYGLSVLTCRLPFNRMLRLADPLQDAENIHPDKLLTDRSTYIGYLESQLERVTNACLTVQSFDQRIETVTSAARLLEEKVLNTGRLLKCSQSYAEENESLQKQAVAELTRRTQQVETAVSSGDQRQQQWETAQDTALQGQLDALEQRMLSKMDRALAKFLEKQLGVGPQSTPVKLPDLSSRLSHMEQSVSLLLSGAPLPADMQRADACTKSLEEVQGVLGQEMQGLKAERTKFKDLLHDAKWTAGQAAGPDQASAQQVLDGIQHKVESETRKGMECLAQAKAELQALAHGLSSSRSSQQQEQPGSTAQLAPGQQPSGLSHTTDRLMPRQQHDQPSLRAATQRAEQGLQQHGEQVQGQMHSMQDTLQAVCQSLQSLQAAFQQPPATAQTQSKEGVPMSPKRSNLELSRSTSRNPPDSPGAAGTPHKRTMRRTASHLSPRKDQDKAQAGKRQWIPGGSVKQKDPPTPFKVTISKSDANTAGGHVLQRTMKRRQRLQELYAELQSLGD